MKTSYGWKLLKGAPLHMRSKKRRAQQQMIDAQSGVAAKGEAADRRFYVAAMRVAGIARQAAAGFHRLGAALEPHPPERGTVLPMCRYDLSPMSRAAHANHRSLSMAFIAPDSIRFSYQDKRKTPCD